MPGGMQFIAPAAPRAIVFGTTVELNTIGEVVMVTDDVTVTVLVVTVTDGKNNLFWRLVGCSSAGSSSSLDEVKADDTAERPKETWLVASVSRSDSGTGTTLLTILKTTM